MAGNGSEEQPVKAHSGPDVVAPTNKVNVALPFGTIHIEESSKELAELGGTGLFH
jgi:hypothetical protein